MAEIRKVSKKDIETLVRLLREQSEVGLEMESLRVTPEGFLAHTPHPFPDEPQFDRDFCENQVEIITPVCYSAEEACRTLCEYSSEVRRRLLALPTGPELLWPFSNPPYCRGEEDVPIAQFTGEAAEKTEYRNYLSEKYGRRLMLLSGIHYNYSYPPEALDMFAEICGKYTPERGEDPAEFRRMTAETAYLMLAEKAAFYSWLIVALTAASPVSDGSFWEDAPPGTPGKEGLSSVRCSEYGYWNRFVPTFSYESADAYIASVMRYIGSGYLQSPRELYYPIRLKPRGAYDVQKLREGIGHIEFRMLDLNPFAGGALALEDLEFLHLLIAWMTLMPRQRLNRRQQEETVANMKAAAHYPLEEVRIDLPFGDESVRVPLAEAALGVLDSMEEILGEDPAIGFQREKILHPEKRYAERIRRICGTNGEDYIAAGLRLAAEAAEGSETNVQEDR